MRWRKPLVVIVIILSVLALTFLILTEPVDRTHYKETGYYKNTIARFDNLAKRADFSGDTISAGWAKINITPTIPLALAGYGKRRGKLYEGVHDSLYIRTIVFDNNLNKVAFVSLDLLITPPEVIRMLKEEYPNLPIPLDQVFFTATHTHASFGGWAPGLTGELFAGDFDMEVVRTLAEAIIASIKKADSNKEKVKIGFSRIKAEDLVMNRLVGEKGETDPWIRVVKIQNERNNTALLTTYAAHATCLRSSFVELSGDYPGKLVDLLERHDSIDFAIFGAGAMASQMATKLQLKPLKRMQKVAEELSEDIILALNFLPTTYETQLGNLNLPLSLKEPHFRVTKNRRIRPYLFYEFFGNYPAKINSLRIGEILFLGTPCDFSGELVDELMETGTEQGLNVIVTSFNGGYVGYITKDKWYDLDKYETQTMNWFGPQNGAYFLELMKRLIDINGR